MLRWLPISLALLLFATAIAGPPSVRAAGPATIVLPTVQCLGDTADVTFTWQHSGGTVQWLDLTLFDNSFSPGTFLAAGPLPYNETRLTWPGLQVGVPHFWRVNTLTSEGWLASTTGVFVPCGGPVLLWGPSQCDEDGGIAIRFRWAPATPAVSVQWLEIVQEGGYGYTSFGPLSPDTAETFVSGFLNDVSYAFRLSYLANAGWESTSVGAFRFICGIGLPQSNSTAGCHPAYTGACLNRDSEDYDCDGGEGDGPDYIGGPVRLVANDVFGLDDDGDRVGCEPGEGS